MAMRMTSARLAALAACIALLVLAALLSHARLCAQQHAQALAALDGVLPRDRYDNDPLADVIYLGDIEALGSGQPLPIHRARLHGQPSAVVVDALAQGYGGAIHLRIGIARDGQVLGVRILAHAETPGLGDAFATDGGQWLHSLAGKSAAADWRPRRDGGEFDQFAGATVTPRAVLARVDRVLQAYTQRADTWFAAPSATQAQPHD
jgi:Na+-translocating ferredoxin:NAD+ oxidoreductase subunit G